VMYQRGAIFLADERGRNELPAQPHGANWQDGSVDYASADPLPAGRRYPMADIARIDWASIFAVFPQWRRVA